MNKSIATLAICVLVGAVAFQALAQNGTKPPVTQPTASATAAPSAGVTPVRVAVLNTNKVLKGFNKAQQLNSYISGMVNNYGQQITAKRDEGSKLNTELAKEMDPAKAEQLKRRITQLEREMQDLDQEARKEVSSKQGTIAVEIYKNIEDVVSRVAAANGFDLVLSYPDATTEQEMYSQPNVVRKLASQAAVPMFYKRHIDLTDAVVQTLNATYQAPAAPITQAGATTPAAPTAPVGTNTGMPKKP